MSTETIAAVFRKCRLVVRPLSATKGRDWALCLEGVAGEPIVAVSPGVAGFTRYVEEDRRRFDEIASAWNTRSDQTDAVAIVREFQRKARETATEMSPQQLNDLTLWCDRICGALTDSAIALTTRETILRIIRDQPFYPDTHTGTRQQWVKDQVAEKVKALFATEEAAAVPGVAFQTRVKPWLLACFGEEIANDKLERADRFLEEVFELLQSDSYPRERIRALEGYVFDREPGEPFQETGGVMTTLAAYSLAHGRDMHEAGETELARIWTKVEKIRAKQAAKPSGSALPIAFAGSGDGALRAELAETIRTRLLGVDPGWQDVELEDADWRLILAALASHPPATGADGVSTP